MESEDFRFYQSHQTALDNGDMYILSGKTTLPRAGGWMDQDYYEAQDLLTYLRGYAWAYQINHPNNNVKRDGLDDLFNFDRPGAVADIDDFVN